MLIHLNKVIFEGEGQRRETGTQQLLRWLTVVEK